MLNSAKLDTFIFASVRFEGGCPLVCAKTPNKGIWPFSIAQLNVLTVDGDVAVDVKNNLTTTLKNTISVLVEA
jgi:hypothetical protein